jgi:hypothetical protein
MQQRSTKSGGRAIFSLLSLLHHSQSPLSSGAAAAVSIAHCRGDNETETMVSPPKPRPYLQVRFVTALLILGCAFKICLDDASIRRHGLLSTNHFDTKNHDEWQVRHQHLKVQSGRSISQRVNQTSLTDQSRPSTSPVGFAWNVHQVLETTDEVPVVRKQENLWEDSNVIPQWMKDYFVWHQQERQKLNETNWESVQYLLLRCVPVDKKCSGASDRLKSVPVAIRMAEQAQPRRMLFIAWRRPCSLEEFLIPPQGGFDWRLPDWLAEKVDIEQRGPKFWLEDNADIWPKVKDPIVRMKNIRGSDYYENLRKSGESSFDEVYHDVWSALFQPSPAVAALVAQQMKELNLVPREYVAAHVRAMYVSDTRENQEEVDAVNCASQLGPGLPIFFASDSKNTSRQALVYAKSKGATIVARQTDKEPIHLDRGLDFLFKSDDWQGRPASDFYDVFVDLFLIAGARCVAYGVGGYGSWASLLGGNNNCSINHRETNCTWTPPSE